MHVKLDLVNEHVTEHVATYLASVLSAPLVLGFSGDIGTGKTTFIRAMLRSLGIQGAIKSPTYALVESYTIKNLLIHHFDLYRIQEEAELDYIGFRDYFLTPAICCIEWSEHIGTGQDCIDIQLTLSLKGTGRALQMHATSVRGRQVLSQISHEVYNGQS